MHSEHDDEVRRRGVYRELNDQLAQLDTTFNKPESAATVRVRLRCECGNRACVRAIPMMLSDYERVRANPRCSVVAPNHEDPTVEAVIDGDPFHTVVEMLAGAPSRIATDTDPRRRASLRRAKRASPPPPTDAPAGGAR